MNNEKYISALRAKCKDASDHEFVDAMESIMTEFEKPRKEPEYFIPIGPFTEAWDKALRDEIDRHNK